MICGNHQQIVVAHRLLNLRQAGVEFFERAGIAGDIVAMAVEHIEINQVGEDQAAWRRL